MFVLRVDFLNGLHLEHNYADIAYATEMRKRVEAAMKDPELVHIIDEAGREGEFRGDLVQAVYLVDVESEVRSAATLRDLIQETQKPKREPREISPSPGPPVNGWLGH